MVIEKASISYAHVDSVPRRTQGPKLKAFYMALIKVSTTYTCVHDKIPSREVLNLTLIGF